jgi:hypothetical protein
MSWQGVKAELERIELDEGELLGVLLNFTTDVTGWNKKMTAPNYTNQIGHLQVKSAATFCEIHMLAIAIGYEWQAKRIVFLHFSFIDQSQPMKTRGCFMHGLKDWACRFGFRRFRHRISPVTRRC